MEELGLVLVEESFSSLREMLRVARGDPSMFNDAIRRSIEVLQSNTCATNEGHMRFIARERHGGVRRLRRAIRRELELFSDELAVDLAAFPIVGDWSVEDRRMFSALIVETMVAMAAELIDASPGRGSRHHRPHRESDAPDLRRRTRLAPPVVTPSDFVRVSVSG